MQTVYGNPPKILTLEEMKDKFLDDLKTEKKVTQDGKCFITRNKLIDVGQKYRFSLYVSDGDEGEVIYNTWVDEFLWRQGNIFYFNDLF